MSQEAKYIAIILNKQLFGEADEIITFFTHEAGKVRGLAKSVRLAKSKLQNFLQKLLLINLTLAGRSHLPKVAFAEIKDSFSRLREDKDLTALAFYASEMVLRFTPDGQKNEKLFNLFLSFLQYLSQGRKEALQPALAKFKAGFLSAVGLSAAAHQSLQSRARELEQALALEACPFGELKLKSWPDLQPLQKFLSDFIAYHLEREVKSERFLKSVV